MYAYSTVTMSKVVYVSFEVSHVGESTDKLVLTLKDDFVGECELTVLCNPEGFIDKLRNAVDKLDKVLTAELEDRL